MASYGCQWPYGDPGLCSSAVADVARERGNGSGPREPDGGLLPGGLPQATLDAQRSISQVPCLLIDLLAQEVLKFLALCVHEATQPSTLCSCGGAPKRGGTSLFALIMPPWLSGGMCFFASPCPRTWQRRHTTSTATSSGRSSCSTAFR
jgi:hypothetical protein